MNKGDILTFNCTGATQTVILPAGIFRLTCYGAQGGKHTTESTDKYAAGGFAQGTITLYASETLLYIYVGQAGDITGSNAFGGGGAGYAGESSGGGGASDIRIGTDSLYARVIVAGGGGGLAYALYNSTNGGGAGGGETGANGGIPSGDQYTHYGAGGSQYSVGRGGFVGNNVSGAAIIVPETVGGFGSFGVGGDVIPTLPGASKGGGGGGGWYGGGAGFTYTSRCSSGGGGSGFVWVGNYAPIGYLLGANYYLTDTTLTQGGRTGNGLVTIEIVYLASTNSYAEIFQTVYDIKNDIRTAINAKGVYISESLPISQYAEQIMQISNDDSGGGGSGLNSQDTMALTFEEISFIESADTASISNAIQSATDTLADLVCEPDGFALRMNTSTAIDYDYDSFWIGFSDTGAMLLRPSAMLVNSNIETVDGGTFYTVPVTPNSEAVYEITISQEDTE